MIVFIVIVVLAIIYAIIRAFHDSHVSHGKWKIWAFVEGLLFDVIVVGLCWRISGDPWWYMIFHGLMFAFLFWLEL